MFGLSGEPSSKMTLPGEEEGPIGNGLLVELFVPFGVVVDSVPESVGSPRVPVTDDGGPVGAVVPRRWPTSWKLAQHGGGQDEKTAVGPVIHGASLLSRVSHFGSSSTTWCSSSVIPAACRFIIDGFRRPNPSSNIFLERQENSRRPGATYFGERILRRSKDLKCKHNRPLTTRT